MRSLEDMIEGAVSLTPTLPQEIEGWASRRFGVFPEETRASIERMMNDGRVLLDEEGRLFSRAGIGSTREHVDLDVFRSKGPSGEPLSMATLRHNAHVAGWVHGAMDHCPPSRYTDLLSELGVMPNYRVGKETGRMDRESVFASARAAYLHQG